MSALETHKALIHVEAVTLRARDMQALAGWCDGKLGLDRIASVAGRISLRSGGEAHLHVDAAPKGEAGSERTAGLSTPH